MYGTSRRPVRSSCFRLLRRSRLPGSVGPLLALAVLWCQQRTWSRVLQRTQLIANASPPTANTCWRSRSFKAILLRLGSPPGRPRACSQKPNQPVVHPADFSHLCECSPLRWTRMQSNRNELWRATLSLPVVLRGPLHTLPLRLTRCGFESGAPHLFMLGHLERGIRRENKIA